MKRLFLALLVSTLTLSISAQGLFSFGPKIGWNNTRMTTNYNVQYDNQLKDGFQGGFFAGLSIKKFYVQPEAYFSFERGALQTSFGDPLNPGSPISISQTVNLFSVDIPLLLGYKLIDLRLLRLRIWAGPVVSYILTKQYGLSINGFDQPSRIVADDFKNSTWSAQVGAGIDFLKLTFDVGYDIGLQNFLAISSLNNFGLRNNVFYCSVGWRIF
jgi:hypothetical protein